MHRIRVGVLRGGPSSEYEVSLKTGATVLNNFRKEDLKDKYNARDIFIDKNGIWYSQGLPVLPHEALNHVDVVFNALHGHYGEDGKVQHILENHAIPYTGSGSFASAIGMNKLLSKDVYRKNNLKTPQSRTFYKRELDFEEDAKIKMVELFKSFPLPIIIKPVSSGSSMGVTLAMDFPSFEEAIHKALSHGDTVLIEEFIQGKEATCAVIDHFRDTQYYALPPIEIVSLKNNFFDYDAKYNGQSKEIVPGNFSESEKIEIERLAIEAHKALGLRHYSRSDFIIHPRRGIFILESNTLPGLTEESLLPKALHSVGASVSYFLDHIVQLALNRK